jgi:hypothetical protein
MGLRKSVFGCIFGVFLFVAIFPQAFAAAKTADSGEYVPMSLVEKAATFYGEERWPGCSLISITPYFAMDGSTNAYAVQFAKEGCSFTTEDQLAGAVAISEAEERTVRENKPTAGSETKLEEGDVGTHTAWDRNEVSVTVTEQPGTDNAAAHAYLPPGALEQGQKQREDYEQHKMAVAEWRQEVRTAANASVLADQVGTVIIAARYDLYPLLERFDGVAPHIKHESEVRALAGITAGQEKAIERTYYLGPLAIFHEITVETGVKGETKQELIDPASDRVLDLEPEHCTPGSGSLAPAPAGKCAVSPQEFWDAIDQQGAPPRTGGDNPPVGASHTIPGVPYYHQDDYGANCCACCASAQALGYCDDNGYGNLVDNGSSTTGHENELVYNLMRAMNYNPSSGISSSAIEPGIEAVCNDNQYGNDLTFNVISDYSVSWTSDIVAEINAHRPFVYGNFDTGSYPYWAHATTGTGYNDDSGHKLYVHYNYPPDTPYELNWDNISPSNEAIYKVNPSGTATFDCVWSEDIEGTFPGPWSVGNNGSGTGYWDDTIYRSHNITTDPSPPGGAYSWSAYCVGSHVSPPGPYPNNIDNGWMIYGPFSTSGKSSGEISAYIWRNITGSGQDFVGLFASVNGTDFWGSTWCGGIYPSWYRKTLDLTNVYTLGNIMNRSQVWVAVWFRSDSSGTSEGAYVDDITIKLSGQVSGPGLAADFGPSGLWFYDDADWTRIAGSNPTMLETYDSKLVAKFSSGLYEYGSGSFGWSRIATSNTEEVLGIGSILYADFGALGLYMYDGSSWTCIAGSNPTMLAEYNTKLVARFSSGLYMWAGGSWNKLAGSNAEEVLGIGANLYADFGPSGLHIYHAGWTQIAGSTTMLGSYGTTLVAKFSTGLYRHNGGTSWTRIATTNAEEMLGIGANLYVDFGASGLHFYNGFGWTQIAGSNPSMLGSYDTRLAAKFSTGLYRHNGGTSWTRIATTNTEDMIGVNL